MPTRPLRLAVLLPRCDPSPAQVRFQLDLARVADDLWIDELIVSGRRGLEPFSFLSAAAAVTSTVGLVAGVSPPQEAEIESMARAAATAQGVAAGRLALLVEGLERDRGTAEVFIEACRARASSRLTAHIEGPPTPEVVQLAATAADGWQFPPNTGWTEITGAVRSVVQRRAESGRSRRLEVRTLWTAVFTGGEEGVPDRHLDELEAHLDAGSSVAVVDLDAAVVQGIDPRRAVSDLGAVFADFH